MGTRRLRCWICKQDQDQIDVLDQTTGMISHWGLHDRSPGVRFLRGSPGLTPASASAADSQSIIHALGCTQPPRPFVCPQGGGRYCLLDETACTRLRLLADERHAQADTHRNDLQVDLSVPQLQALVGEESVSRLVGAFGGAVRPTDSIKVRRVEATAGGREVIQFHTDHALAQTQTMHVPLNDEEEYDGGRLVFALPDGLRAPPRPAGSATVHDWTIPHGCTAMVHGVRYGLFLLKARESAL